MHRPKGKNWLDRWNILMNWGYGVLLCGRTPQLKYEIAVPSLLPFYSCFTVGCACWKNKTWKWKLFHFGQLYVRIYIWITDTRESTILFGVEQQKQGHRLSRSSNYASVWPFRYLTFSSKQINLAPTVKAELYCGSVLSARVYDFDASMPRLNSQMRFKPDLKVRQDQICELYHCIR